jgi:hypothetical protein
MARLHFPASRLAKNKKDSAAAAANSQGSNSNPNAEQQQQPDFLASIPNLRQNGGT